MNTTPVVFHPATGEVIENLDQVPPERLADAYAAILDRQAQLKAGAAAVDAELRRRLTMRDRTTTTFGEWEVTLEQRRRADWDADQLEQTLQALVDRGTLTAGELTEVITRPAVVSRSEAGKLAARLVGQPRIDVESCRRWIDDGRPRLRVTRSVALTQPEQEVPW